MGDAFKCDRCQELHDGSPHQYLANGPTADTAIARLYQGKSEGKEYCEPCWNKIASVMSGDD